MHHIRTAICLALLGAIVPACAVARLTLAPDALSDRSEPAKTKSRISAVIVLPPRGSERGQRSELADLERVLLGKGFRVISSGITGRVASGPTEGRAIEASRLSDLERALILAKDSNADALLQVGKMGFSPAERYFVLDDHDPSKLKEVLEPPAKSDGLHLLLKEARYTFQARLINVENGEILVSVDIAQSTSRVAPIDWEVQSRGSETIAPIDTPQRRRRAVTQVMEALSNHISPRDSQGPLGHDGQTLTTPRE